MAEQIKNLKSLVGEKVRIAAYGNIGFEERDTRYEVSDREKDQLEYAEFTMEWIDAGASVIGGCCGTSPETIKTVIDSLTKLF